VEYLDTTWKERLTIGSTIFETMTPNDTDETDETDEMNEPNRTDEPAECEFCGQEFDKERALADHWYHADPESHDLDDEQRQEMLNEQRRQVDDHRVRIDVDIEIPRENWRWAVEQYDLGDPDADELPDPNNYRDQAVGLLEEYQHYEVSDGGAAGADVRHAFEDDGFEREFEGGDGSDETEQEAIAPGVWISPESDLADDEIGAIQRAVVSEERRLASIPEEEAERCERLAGDPTGARPDLRPDQVLDKCAKHATVDYQEALGLSQHVEMPDPTMDAQEVVDSAYDSELRVGSVASARTSPRRTRRTKQGGAAGGVGPTTRSPIGTRPATSKEKRTALVMSGGSRGLTAWTSSGRASLFLGIVGFERCKALIEDFGADPADLFEGDSVIAENWG
jgi:hypothetical protein